MLRFLLINFLKIRSTTNPQKTPKANFISNIFTIILIGIASEINIGIISSDVDKYTAINVPIDINLDEYRLVADAENMKFIEDNILDDKNLSKQKFIVAWGNSMESSKAVNDSKKKIIEMYLNKLPKGKVYQFVCPERDITAGAPHPLFLGIRAKTVKWRLMEYSNKELFPATKNVEK